MWHESNGVVAGDGAEVLMMTFLTLVILITSSGEFSCIYIFLVFSMCLILFHFILFLANFTPFW